MEFKPNGAWVILPDPTITQTESGIFVGDEAAAANAQRSNILEVLAVGPMCNFVEVGDTVMVDPRTEAIKSRIDEQDLLLVGEHQLLGKW
tara:strand:- start:1153 stop:1422 length:270 start_codon:yes stop_codon:yes gene_type:complete